MEKMVCIALLSRAKLSETLGYKHCMPDAIWQEKQLGPGDSHHGYHLTPTSKHSCAFIFSDVT